MNQLELLEDVKDAINAYYDGWVAYKNESTYTYNSELFSFENSSTKNSVLDQFVETIFSGLSS